MAPQDGSLRLPPSQHISRGKIYTPCGAAAHLDLAAGFRRHGIERMCSGYPNRICYLDREILCSLRTRAGSSGPQRWGLGSSKDTSPILCITPSHTELGTYIVQVLTPDGHKFDLRLYVGWVGASSALRHRHLIARVSIGHRCRR